MVFEYMPIPVRGCAYARNAAISFSQTDILLWTDPDMVHSPDWAWNLACALRDHASEIVGGKILPLWHTRPRWYMTTHVMADHYSLIDLGDDLQPTERIIGGSMGLHIGRLGPHARFDERLGRQDGTLLGGVDAEFCERAISNGFRVRYVGQAVAHHQITVERTRLKWIARKFYYGGLSRGLRGGKPRPMNQNRSITDYILLGMFAPFYLTGLVYSRRLRHLRSRPMLKHGEMK
jgi:glycosyltransferase involved in cell wall biosynthesis